MIEAEIFAAGYDRGREDGIALAVAFVAIVVDYFGIPPGAARRLLPAANGDELATAIKGFGDRCYRSGRKDQKQRDLEGIAAPKPTRKTPVPGPADPVAGPEGPRSTDDTQEPAGARDEDQGGQDQGHGHDPDSEVCGPLRGPDGGSS